MVRSQLSHVRLLRMRIKWVNSHLNYPLNRVIRACGREVAQRKSWWLEIKISRRRITPPKKNEEKRRNVMLHGGLEVGTKEDFP
jgi:hypothetical protein